MKVSGNHPPDQIVGRTDECVTDNAIPIEGWISDPTDNDLLHLIPLLEGLQYVTDVRALLALRQGQAAQA